MTDTILIYCDNRESFYSNTTAGNVTKWSKNILHAEFFHNKKEAFDLVSEFKNSAMGDTKYIRVVTTVTK